MSVAHDHEVYLHDADDTRRHQQARISDKEIVLVLGDAVVDLGWFGGSREKLNESRLQDDIRPSLHSPPLVEKRDVFSVVVERYLNSITIYATDSL